MSAKISKKILILPWYWAKPTQVAKYCQLYQELGYHPIVYWAGLVRNFIPGQMRRVGYDKSTYEWRRNTHFHAVHAFSGGIYSYFSFLHSPVSENPLPRLRHSKLIIDGGPIIPNHQVINMFLRRALGIPKAHPMLVKPLVDLWFMDRTRVIKKNFPIDQLSTITAQIPVPKLVLNCSDDSYTNQEHIDLFLKECESLSPEQPLISHNFLESQHCQNYRYHPVQYREILSQFLDT